MSNSKDFSNKVVIITGSTSGIGEGIAIYLSKLNAKVVITGRNGDNVRRVADHCKSVSPQQLEPLEVIADLTIDDDAKSLINATIEKYGQIDVLVNNAGIFCPTTIYDQNLMETYEKVMRLDLRSVVYLSHLTAPYLEKTKGNIVNISSIGAIKPTLYASICCMAKCALDMFTKCLAIELGPKGVRVNSINVGAVESNVGAEFGFSRIIKEVAKQTPLGLLGKPEDIAYLTAYLASDDAAFITGSTVAADAGALLANLTLDFKKA